MICNIKDLDTLVILCAELAARGVTFDADAEALTIKIHGGC